MKNNNPNNFRHLGNLAKEITSVTVRVETREYDKTKAKTVTDVFKNFRKDHK